MTHSIVMAWSAGLLQIAVADCALRLNRLFGTVRVGWSLFSAFALLALLHLIQSFDLFGAGGELAIKINLVCAFISLLLLTRGCCGSYCNHHWGSRMRPK